MRRARSTITLASAFGYRRGDVLNVAGERLVVRRIRGCTLTVVRDSWWRRWPRRAWWWPRRGLRRVRHAWWDLLDRWEGLGDDD